MRKRSLLKHRSLLYAGLGLLLWVAATWSGALILEGSSGAALQFRIGLWAALVVTAFGALAWGLWVPAYRKVEQIGHTVKAYANGDFSLRLPAQDGSELSVLCAELNRMAQQLQERAETEKIRQREQEAVLASMEEGVIAVDTSMQLIKINRMARQWLGLEDVVFEGRPVAEVLRQADLHRFIELALSSEESLSADIVLQGSSPRQVHVTSASLRGGGQERLGVVLMLNDTTRVRQLENLRRDFVANVSHELKTPITSIKGFMETLLDGAMHDPVESRRFLEIIARQADRLDAIIEDLLSLSRIEQEAERGIDAPKSVLVEDVMQAILLALQAKADARHMRIEVQCDSAVHARIGSHLLEQAISNLVDNAIKYGPEGTAVCMRAREEGEYALIEVADDGPGIAKEHHARISERFYRIDKSRSRRLGGTGLGLSIVKHIVQAHGGDVSLDSELGKGSVFTVRLPR